MSEPTRLLVVANRTADSEELLAAITARCAEGPVAVTLLVPATWEVGDPHGGRESAQRHMRAAIARLRAAGVAVEGILGDPDPAVAVEQAWHPGDFDAVLVSTLPSRVSKWLRLDLPKRVERLTGVPVQHVVASGPGQAASAERF
jgi:GABA permease